MPRYEERGVRWVGLEYFQVDNEIVSPTSGRIELSGPALAVLDVLYRLGRYKFKMKPHLGRDPVTELPVCIQVGQYKLCERTGLPDHTVVVKAVNELVRHGFIERERGGSRTKGKGRNYNRYCLLHSGKHLLKRGSYKTGTWKPVPFGWNRTFLGSNEVPYFTCADRFITDVLNIIDKRSEIRLYHAILWMAESQKTGNEFEVAPSYLRKVSGIKTSATYKKTLRKLEELGLIRTDGSRIRLCDPETRMPLNVAPIPSEENFRNWRDEQGDRYDPVKVLSRKPEWYLKQLLGEDADVREGPDGEYRFRCPLHVHKTPIASINCHNGKWKCFGDQEERSKGNLWQLVAWMNGFTTPKQTYIHMAKAAGTTLKYFPPQNSFTRLMELGTRYHDYLDKDGLFLYRKFRVKKPDGTKHCPLYRQVRGKWLWSRRPELERALYRWPKPDTQIVLIPEGEQDVETLEALHLRDDDGGDVLVTTTGGSGSWVDALADEFIGMFVVIMPDSDTPGKRYGTNIAKSLDKRGTKHCTVPFTDVAGVDDVTDFLKEHRPDELVSRLQKCVPVALSMAA